MRAFPILMVYGGPNGSGKSTLTKQIPPIGSYVNADEIQRKLGCSPLEAAQNAEQTREALLSEGRSFSIESVLSTPRNFDLMHRAGTIGYRRVCLYMVTNDPEINKNRVAARVAKGGNAVPVDRIVPRYWRALSMLPQLFEVCDECYIFDNSMERGKGEPACIVSWVDGVLELFPSPVWPREKLEALVTGKYTPKSI